ncbi:MAG TPA: FG-GAP repeat protein [Patescibacteria group bacterium]|nr:FG-GAP repeat protein [Patescibacteria group bacterium]
MKSLLLTLAFITLPLFVVGWIVWSDRDETLSSALSPFQKAGEQVKENIYALPVQTFTENDDSFHLIDTTSDGIDIQFGSAIEQASSDEAKKSKEDQAFALTFPKDYSQPLEVKLDDKRSILMTDLGGSKSYTSTLYTDTPLPTDTRESTLFQKLSQSIFTKKAEAETAKYLAYQDEDERKLISYVYQKDQTTGEKRLKQWVLYKEGTGNEQESYSFQNTKLKKNDDGSVSGYYFTEEALENQTTGETVAPSLLERAGRVMAQERERELLEGNSPPDFIIPKPYYINSQGEHISLDWNLHTDTSTLSVSFFPKTEDYPLALDPTLSFTAPGNVEGGVAIVGEGGSTTLFGYTMTAGDFNADGKTDLVVGAYQPFTSITGRVYIFLQ